MKNLIIIISIFSFLLSCSNESATVTNENESKSTEIDISKLNSNKLLDYIIDLEANLLDTAQNALKTNKQNAIKLLESTKHFAERFPKDTLRKSILYRGVMAARGLEKDNEAIQLLDKILLEYPNDQKRVETLFEKAFLLDEKMRNIEEAKKIYFKIAEEYPTHQFGIDSKARLNTIDMTDEQLLEFFAKQNAK